MAESSMKPRSGKALSGADATKPPTSSPRADGEGEDSARAAAATSSKPKPLGRRPLVSKEAKEAMKASRRLPFYRRIPRGVLVALALVAVVAVLAPVIYRAITRAKDPDEWAVREQLYSYRFDGDASHFAKIDEFGAAKGPTIAVRLLTDTHPAEISGSHSTSTAADLALEYLLHYASVIKVEPPPKAVEAFKLGSSRLRPPEWQELQTLFGKWLADAQAKGAAK